MARPGRLEEVEERLELINHLKRKYGRTIEEIIAKEAEMPALELEEKQDEEHKELQARAETLRGELKRLAGAVRSSAIPCGAPGRGGWAGA